jgi:SOS-response transcriptional repressor LexA
VDDTVPSETDYAVRVSGDSMTPRFVDRQIIFIHEQPYVEDGEVGIFALNGDAYCKRKVDDKLLSLNPRYKPIKLREWDEFRTFGKVLG